LQLLYTFGPLRRHEAIIAALLRQLDRAREPKFNTALRGDQSLNLGLCIPHRDDPSS
jgi:hypothetical protein